MDQHPNQPTNTGPRADQPVKRKRGRPRKDESQAQAQAQAQVQYQAQAQAIFRPPMNPVVVPTRIFQQGLGFSAARPTTPQTASKGKAPMVVDPVDYQATPGNEEDLNSNDELVGKGVTGVLECATDAGYLLKVRVNGTDVYMKGLVFKEDSVVPITPENDIAPNVKMYKRKDLPIPQVPQLGGGSDSFSKPTKTNQDQQQMQPPAVETIHQQESHTVILPQGQTELQQQKQRQQEEPSLVNVDQQQQQPPAVETVPQQESHTVILPQGQSEQQQQEPSLVNVVQQHETPSREPSVVVGGEEELETGIPVMAVKSDVQVEVVEVDALEPIPPEDKLFLSSPSPKAPRRDDLGESSEPLAKVQKTDQTTENIGSSDVHSEECVPELAAKVDEAIDTTVLEEAVVPAKEAEFPGAKEPTVMETDVVPEIGITSGFQVSMENTDTDEPDTVPEEPTNEVSTMENRDTDEPDTVPEEPTYEVSPMETGSGEEAGDQ